MRDISGERFNRVEVLSYEGYEHGSHRWRVRCDCGVEFVTDYFCLIYGRTQSCGCLKRERLIAYTKENKPYLLKRKRKK